MLAMVYDPRHNRGVKPFLILQLRPEDDVADDELAAFQRFGGLTDADIHRVRMEQTTLAAINLADYSAVIVGGGPSNVSDAPAKKSQVQQRFERQLAPLMDRIIEADFPYLGACYGLGYLAYHLGGAVAQGRYSEGVGAVTITMTEAAADDPLTKGLPKQFRAFAGHKESCQVLPPGAILLSSSANCPIHLIRVKKNMYGAQFHTELDVEGIILRIRAYKYAGYFPPEDADALIAAVRRETITEPGKILRRFVERYRQPA